MLSYRVILPLLATIIFSSASHAIAIGRTYGNVVLNQNEVLALTAFTEVFVNHNIRAVDTYFAPGYVDRDPGQNSTLTGLAKLKEYATSQSKVKFETGLVASTGPIVGFRARATPPTGTPLLQGHYYRVINGKIAEHWVTMQNEVPAQNTASGNAMFDPREHFKYDAKACGRDEIRNIWIPRYFLNKVFNDRNFTVLQTLVDPNFIQHNPLAGNGVGPFLQLVQTLPPGGYFFGFTVAKCDITMTHSVIGFFGNVGVTDYYRFKNGIDVEHWDIAAFSGEYPSAPFDPEEETYPYIY